MSDLAETIAKGAEGAANNLNQFGYKADFTLDSIERLDVFFDKAMEDGQPKPDGPLAQDTQIHLFTIGAYVAETLRREMGGKYLRGDDPANDWEIILMFPDGSKCWPFGQVLRRFEKGAEEGLHLYAKIVSGRARAGMASQDRAAMRDGRKPLPDPPKH